MHPLRRVLAVVATLTAAGVACLAGARPAEAAAQSGPDAEARLTLRAVPARSVVGPGDQVPVAIVMEVAPGWHVWTSEVQAQALPSTIARFDGAQYTDVRVKLTPEGSAKAWLPNIQWPESHTIKADLGEGLQTFAVYEGKSVAYLPVEIAADATAGTLVLNIEVAYQACSDTCEFPTTATTTLELPVAPGQASTAVQPDLFAGFNPSVWGELGSATAKPVVFDVFGWVFTLDPKGAAFLPLLLVIAFAGGILLNFTPCVLPIIPLKVMGLSAAAAGSRSRTFWLGAAMSAGVVLFWVVLGALLGTVSQFTQVNQLFQYPLFTIGVGVFIALMAIGMAGFFSVGLPSWVYAIEPKHETVLGSVIFGVMTAVLSTPCTAPLMGAAAGWAVTAGSTAVVLSVFFAIGFGMASPYLVLSAFPQLARKMPKTGPASDLLKQVMGLLLLAAAAYFIGAGINGFMEEPSKLYWWVVAAIGAGAGLWMMIRTVAIAKSRTNRAVFATVGAVIAGLSIAIGPVLTYERLPWKRYTQAALNTALADGKVVVLDFTAEWCLTCKALEKTVLESDAVTEALTRDHVVLLKADITGTNEEGLAKMRELGRSTIPLLVVYAPPATEVFKSDAYTPQQVIEAVSEKR